MIILSKYIKNFKQSKTVRLAFLKKLGGVITIILANLGYFEDSVTPAIFGTILIVLGVIDHYIRTLTDSALGDK